VKTPSAFLSRRTNELPRRIKTLLLIFEVYAQARCFAWVDAKLLAFDYGCRRSRMFELLQEAVKLHVIKRIESEPGRRRGTIYLLLQRVDPDLPVFTPGRDKVEDVREIVRQFKGKTEWPGTDKNPTDKVRFSGPSRSGFAHLSAAAPPIKSLSLNEGEVKKDPPLVSPIQRQRQNQPKVAPAPKVCRLTRDLDALPQDKRAEIMADPVMARERASTATRCPPASALSLPRSTEEALAQLPGSDGAMSRHTAECLVRDFGSKMDRNLWKRFVEICESVRLGQVPAAELLDAYRQGMSPKAEKPGAVFWIAWKRNLKALGWPV